jgi:hypothetical protein
MPHAGSGVAVVLAIATVLAFGATRGASEWTLVLPPPIEASFAHSSYAPGQVAVLTVRTRTGPLEISIERVDRSGGQSDLLAGTPASDPILVKAKRTQHLRIGNWPSGMYDARLQARDGRMGFAPFVLRPARWGEHKVAVVMPTNTWQAYNFRDDNHDGVGDTWYASRQITRVDVARPFLNHGVPPHFSALDAGFLTWFARRGHEADFFSDDDLAAAPSAAALARDYNLIVFPGHEEYVLRREYELCLRYRDLGGNLIFLSANNFFREVRREGRWLVRLHRWRDIGRAESKLVGGQIVGWFENRFRNRPLLVVGARREPWLFAGTGLGNGSRFGNYGIEVDERTPASPPGTEVLATIPNIFGRGKTAEMTYYRTARGAKVFAAGVMNFGGTAAFPIPGRMIDNLWARLSRP